MKQFNPKPCELCGREFMPTGTSSKYCSDECRQQIRRAASRKSYHKYADKRREHNRQYYRDNIERIGLKNRKWHQDNKEREAEHKRKYYLDNRDKILAQTLEYQKNNPQKGREKSRLYRDKKRQVPTDNHTKQDVQDKANNCCYCRQAIDFAKPWHEAHIWPVGYVEDDVCLGSDMIINSYPSHSQCNQSVASSIPLETNHPLMQDPVFLDLARRIKEWSYAEYAIKIIDRPQG